MPKIFIVSAKFITGEKRLLYVGNNQDIANKYLYQYSFKKGWRVRLYTTDDSTEIDIDDLWKEDKDEQQV